jgi:hypothetical protein
MTKDLESQIYVPVLVPPPSHLPCATDMPLPPSPSTSRTLVISHLTTSTPEIIAHLASDLGTSALTVTRVGTLVGSAGHLTSSVQAKGTAKSGQKVTVSTLTPMVRPLT